MNPITNALAAYAVIPPTTGHGQAGRAVAAGEGPLVPPVGTAGDGGGPHRRGSGGNDADTAPGRLGGGAPDPTGNAGGRLDLFA